MSQRILIGLCAVLTATCLGMTAFVWKTSAEAVASAKALIDNQRDSLQALLVQSQAHSDRLLERMESTGPAGASGRGQFSIALVEEGSDHPVKGCRVRIERWGDDNGFEIDELTDASGIIDCGMILEHEYKFEIWAPNQLTMGSLFFAHAGRPNKPLRIVVPMKPEPEYDVALEFEWPDEFRDSLKKSVIGVLCTFQHDTLTIDGCEWWRPERKVVDDPESGLYLLLPGRRTQRFNESISVFVPESFSSARDHDSSRAAVNPAKERVLRWRGANHSLVFVGIALSHPSENQPSSDERIWILNPPGKFKRDLREPVPLSLRPGDLNRVRIELPDDFREFIAAELQEHPAFPAPGAEG